MWKGILSALKKIPAKNIPLWFEEWIGRTWRRMRRTARADVVGSHWVAYITLGVGASNHLPVIRKELWPSLEWQTSGMVNIPHHTTFASLPWAESTSQSMDSCVKILMTTQSQIQRKHSEKVYWLDLRLLLNQCPRKSLLRWPWNEMTFTFPLPPHPPQRFRWWMLITCSYLIKIYIN